MLIAFKQGEKAPYLSIYARSITWVKYPKDSCMVDFTLESAVSSKSRTGRVDLCVLDIYFDQNQILENGVAHGDPKYFIWNNFGQAVKPSRPNTASEKRARIQENANASSLLQPATGPQPDPAAIVHHTVTVGVAADELCGDVPDIASEVVIDKHVRPNKNSGLGCKKHVLIIMMNNVTRSHSLCK